MKESKAKTKRSLDMHDHYINIDSKQVLDTIFTNFMFRRHSKLLMVVCTVQIYNKVVLSSGKSGATEPLFSYETAGSPAALS